MRLLILPLGRLSFFRNNRTRRRDWTPASVSFRLNFGKGDGGERQSLTHFQLLVLFDWALSTVTFSRDSCAVNIIVALLT